MTIGLLLAILVLKEINYIGFQVAFPQISPGKTFLLVRILGQPTLLAEVSRGIVLENRS